MLVFGEYFDYDTSMQVNWKWAVPTWTAGINTQMCLQYAVELAAINSSCLFREPLDGHPHYVCLGAGPLCKGGEVCMYVCTYACIYIFVRGAE